MPDKTVKPKIEEVIVGILDGDALQNALDFISFLRANKMSPTLTAANAWAVSYKGQRVCYIRVAGTAYYHNLENGSWHIAHVNYGCTKLIGYTDDSEQYISDEKLNDIVLDKVKSCTRCANCKRGNSLTILEKQFDEVCHTWLLMKNPNADAVNCAKKIVMMRRNAIANKNK